MPESPSLPPSNRFYVSLKRSYATTIIISYAVDWAIILGFAGAGYALYAIEPNKRPFSLLDPTTSNDHGFPHTEDETVPTWLLLVLCLILPTGTILATCLACAPARNLPRDRSQASSWMARLWELHASLLGLALSVIAPWFITHGLKNMFGRPRPDLISRCEPDLRNLTRYVIVGALDREERASIMNPALGISGLVSVEICQQTDSSKLDDGFRSSPSGHASAAAAGLINLSFFLTSKLLVSIPPISARSNAAATTAFLNQVTPNQAMPGHYEKMVALRSQAAAPPIYLLCITVVPFFISVFIAGSRWFDFRHHSSDIIFGYLIGATTSTFAFYYYHLPLGHGVGWAWGPRERDNAWHTSIEYDGMGSVQSGNATGHLLPQSHSRDEAARRTGGR